jgi:hypothetical protein
MNNKMLKKHTKQNKQQLKETDKKKKPRKIKLSLQLFLMANFDCVNEPIDMRVWKGGRFVI